MHSYESSYLFPAASAVLTTNTYITSASFNECSTPTKLLNWSNQTPLPNTNSYCKLYRHEQNYTYGAISINEDQSSY